MKSTALDPSGLALRLVHSESGDSPDTALFIIGTNLVLQKFQSGLGDLVGSGGVSALGGKALRLAQRDYPALASVTLTNKGLVGLEEAMLKASPPDPFSIIASPIAHMISLLVALLGEDIGLLPVRKIWPDIPVVEPPTSLTESAE